MKKYKVKPEAVGSAIDTPKGRFILNDKLSQTKLRYLYELGSKDVERK